MFAPAFAALVNHLLAPASWAREMLIPHAGKVAWLEMAPVRVAVRVAADGTLQAATDDESPAVTIRLTPVTLLEVLGDGEDAWRKAAVEGDTGFAQAISRVAANLRWEAEDDLSKLFGDIAARRMAQAGRAMAQWPGQAAANLAANAAEFLTEEEHLLVTPLQAGQFVRDVDELRDAVDRLEKRIERLLERARSE